jgi:hypothetical protein
MNLDPNDEHSSGPLLGEDPPEDIVKNTNSMRGRYLSPRLAEFS